MPIFLIRARGQFGQPSQYLLPLLLLLLPCLARAQQMAEVLVIGLDYAFQVPATLAPGPTTFGFENRGKVPHEAIIVRVKLGVTVDSVLHADRLAQRALTEVVGILIAEPGGRALGHLLVDLTDRRTYLLLCGFRDAPDQPQHLTMGMVAPIQVR